MCCWPSWRLLLGVVLGGRARAQTVDEILKRGTINIGVLIDLPPYGLLNDKQEPDGYDIEVAKLLGQVPRREGQPGAGHVAPTASRS